jgi:hypothetical protein
MVKSIVGPAALALIMAVTFATASFAQNVTTEHDESVDFSRFKTFAIREGEIKTKSPALSSELTKKRIETELEKALTAKGLKRATGQADLNVFYGLGATRGTETERYPAGWRGRATRVVKVPNAEGTLVIDMRDPTTRALVWRAVATEDERNPSKLAEKLDDMVKKAIKEYPPKK